MYIKILNEVNENAINLGTAEAQKWQREESLHQILIDGKSRIERGRVWV